MTDATLTLRAGTLELQVAPAVGGSIVRFDRVTPAGTQSLLRPGSANIAGPLDSACFPLVPFANRIRGGRFLCDGREVRLAPNMPNDASPLHGQGWLGAWSVVDAGATHVDLAFDHPAGEWPWAYEARQRLELDGTGLLVHLTCRNLSEARMPCALGLHPYYPCDADTVLDTMVTHAWTIDEAVLPVARVQAEGRYDLRSRRICGQALDNGFDGWSGSARITWPGRNAALVLSSRDADRFQVYSPTTGGLFVAEPVQNANAALNAPQEQWPDLGITLLASGAERRLSVRFEVVPAAA